MTQINYFYERLLCVVRNSYQIYSEREEKRSTYCKLFISILYSNFFIFYPIQFPDFYKNDENLFSKNGAVLEFNQVEFHQILAQEKKNMNATKLTEEEGTFASD